jgi:2-polyprenyl-3-methyl-5-hydroxy-6-metoxy-1,4-benzoquinol methylase
MSPLCPVCNSYSLTLKYELKYGKVFECNNCKLAFTNFFKQNYELLANIKEFSTIHKQQVYTIELFRSWARKRLRALKKFLNTGKILEYGPNTGEFLYESAKAGFEPTGVDIKLTVLKTNILSNIKLFECDATNFTQVDEKFDAVVAFHLLEHLSDPKKFLQNVNSNLKSKGILMLDVPNYGSLERRLHKENWDLFCEYHVLHFNKESLSNLLKRCGFKIIKFSSLGPSVIDKYIIKIYYLIRNFIWNRIRKCSREDKVEEINEIKEKIIYKSAKSRIFNIEQKFINFLLFPFLPFKVLQDLFLIGCNLRVFATKNSQ